MTVASTPKCASVCTSSSATRGGASSVAAGRSGRGGGRCGPGSWYSGCSVVMSSKSVLLLLDERRRLERQERRGREVGAGASPTTSGYSCSASTGGFAARRRGRRLGPRFATGRGGAPAVAARRSLPVRAAEDRAERRAGEQERADEEEQDAEDRRAGDADRDADGAAEHLADVAAVVLAERDHQPEAEHDEAGAERADVDERAARDHEAAERDEQHRQHPGGAADERVEAVHERAADPAAVPAGVADAAEEDAERDEPEPPELGAVEGLRPRRLGAAPPRPPGAQLALALGRAIRVCSPGRPGSCPPGGDSARRAARGSAPRRRRRRLGVPRAVGHEPAVDDGAAVAVLRRRLDLDVAVQRRHERRVDHVRDRERVVDRRAVHAVAALVELLEEVGQLGDDATRRARTAQPVGVRTREERLVRDVEPDHRHGDAAAEDLGGGLRVDERVELGGRGDVALGDRAAHPDDALEPLAHVRVAPQQERDVRQRPGRDEHDAGLDQLVEQVGGVHVERPRRRLGQRGPVEAALAVHVRSRAQRARGAVGAGATGTSVRPASSSTFSALRVVLSSVWLPATVVTARSSTSGEASASRIAIASS